jgi:uncharacterized alkaline shock family protein YloU
MNSNVTSEYGKIKIYKQVLLQIAEAAASEVEGVDSIGGSSLGWWDKVLRFLRIGGTKINLEKNIKIVIPLVVKWGYNIVDVAYEVQRRIITAMLDSVNIDSLSVDVKVKKIKRGR